MTKINLKDYLIGKGIDTDINTQGILITKKPNNNYKIGEIVKNPTLYNPETDLFIEINDLKHIAILNEVLAMIMTKLLDMEERNYNDEIINFSKKNIES